MQKQIIAVYQSWWKTILRILYQITKLKQYSSLVEELSGVISETDLKNLDYVSYLEKKYE